MSEHDPSGSGAGATSATGGDESDAETTSTPVSTENDTGAASGTGTIGRGADDAETAPESTGRDGPQFVLALYAILIGVTATAGFLIGTFVDGLRSPMFLFLVPFPATPFGFAAYGGLTIALVLGVPLALVVYVSRNFAE